MIQFVAAAAIGAVGVYAYSSLKKHLDILKAEDLKKAEAKKNPKSLGDLEQDPETGRYTVVNKDED